MRFGSGASALVTQDPMATVLDMGPRLPLAVIVALALLLHGGVAGGATAATLYSEIFAFNRVVSEVVRSKLSETYEVDVVKEKEPPPPPPEEEKPVEPEKPVIKDPTPAPKEPPPPPAAAEAAKVIAQDPEPEAPVDLTGNTFVQGTGSTYAGGVTQAGGTSKTAVTNAAAVATGVVGGTGTAAPPPRVDRSRAAGLLPGSTDWDCPFPAEAEAEQIDQAFVLVRVKVRPDGSAESVTVVQDPGHGFGREARKCAMRKKYTTALDVDGNAIGGETKPIRVNFVVR